MKPKKTYVKNETTSVWPQAHMLDYLQNRISKINYSGDKTATRYTFDAHCKAKPVHKEDGAKSWAVKKKISYNLSGCDLTYISCLEDFMESFGKCSCLILYPDQHGV